MNKFFTQNAEYFYFVFRVIIGITFILHGWMKLPSILSGNMTLMSLAGVIEIVGGLFLIIGLFARWVALISAVQMIFAYFMAHASKGVSPLANGGEAALLFFAAFLVIMAYGAGKWSVDASMHK